MEREPIRGVPIRVHIRPDYMESEFIATSVDHPGLSGHGQTMEAALEALQAALGDPEYRSEGRYG